MKLLLLLALSSCAPRLIRDDPSLLAADRAFARDVLSRKADGWADAFAADGRQLLEGARVVSGRDAIRALMAPVFEKFSLSWEPESAESSGSIGWTFGRYQLTKEGAVVERGRYLTNWRREDGRWKVTLDTGQPEEN